MLRQQITRETAPIQTSTPISPKRTPSKSFGPLSGVVQRAKKDRASVSREERQQLDSAIGTRATQGILSGAQYPWTPSFRGISTELGSDSRRGVVPIQTKRKQGEEEHNQEASTPALTQSRERVQNQAITETPIDLLGSIGTIQRKDESEGSKNQRQWNNTGLPERLKTGIEELSGYSMEDVTVNYNSPKPAKLQALAYTEGTEIHVAPGQEKHLPHEAWHVVQQKQGRVRPTMQMKEEVEINDDAGLEKEADVMGKKALNVKKESEENHQIFVSSFVSQRREQKGIGTSEETTKKSNIVQRQMNKEGKELFIQWVKNNYSDQPNNDHINRYVNMYSDLENAKKMYSTEIEELVRVLACSIVNDLNHSQEGKPEQIYLKIYPEVKKLAAENPDPQILHKKYKQTNVPDTPTIVGNTQTFLAAFISRKNCWEDEDSNNIKKELIEKIKKEQKDRFDKITDNYTLPNVLGLLKDISKSALWRKKLPLYDKWKRPPIADKDEQRNRQKKKNEILNTGPGINNKLIRMNSLTHDLTVDGDKIHRETKSDSNKKGTIKYSPIQINKNKDFNYDKYDYEDYDVKNYSEYTDPEQINFGAGPSGTIGDTILTVRDWCQTTIKTIAKKNATNLVGQQKLATKQWEAIKHQQKTEVYKKLAVATIATLVNEGHHSLLETIIPVQKLLELDLGNLPPEEILIKKLMTEKMKYSLSTDLEEALDIAFRNDLSLKAEVRKRILSYLH